MQSQIKKVLSILAISSGLIFSNLLFCAGAGIIPYIKRGGKVSFLLSIENRSKVGLVITDFGGGGGRDKETAAKEGYEETMGIFTVKHTKDILRKRNQAAGKSYFKRKMGSILSGSDRHYVTYFVDVTDKVKAFGGRKDTIDKLSYRLKNLKANRKFKKVPSSFKEKRGFIWLTKDELSNMIASNDSTRCFVLKNFRWSRNSSRPKAAIDQKHLKLYHRLRGILKGIPNVLNIL